MSSNYCVCTERVGATSPLVFCGLSIEYCVSYSVLKLVMLCNLTLFAAVYLCRARQFCVARMQLVL